jgi:hypothetical protein
MSLRDEAREAILARQARTGENLRQIANAMGYAHRTLVQFNSHTGYGDGNGEATARAVLKWFAEHPVESPALPGKLY